MSFWDRFRRPKQKEGPTAGLAKFIVTDVKKITSQQFDRLCEELALPAAVLRSYLELLAIRQEPAERTDTTLRGMAGQYGKLKEQFEGLKAED
ncbi:MAG: hypothetical protein V3T65_03780, partial [Acidobacteriota bacterium]